MSSAVQPNAAGQQPSPMRFFEAMRGYQKTAAMKAAVELELFTAIGQGDDTVEKLAEKCGASSKGMRVLADCMVCEGFLTKSDGKYALTQDAAVFLDKRSPAYCGGAVVFLGSPILTGHFSDLTATVRKGGSLDSDGGTVAPDNSIWVDFARGMAPLMTPAAQVIAQQIPKSDSPIRVLDIAAGHGKFGITVAQQHPNAQITALDWKAVLELAREHAEHAGVADRYQLMPGSAFELDFGDGWDVVLITNFLHHFDAATCEAFMKKVYAALKPGGVAVTLEFVPDDERMAPAGAVEFALTMLASTPAGDAYTFRELQQIFQAAGFAENRLIPVGAMPQSVVVSLKN